MKRGVRGNGDRRKEMDRGIEEWMVWKERKGEYKRREREGKGQGGMGDEGGITGKRGNGARKREH